MSGGGRRGIEKKLVADRWWLSNVGQLSVSGARRTQAISIIIITVFISNACTNMHTLLLHEL